MDFVADHGDFSRPAAIELVPAAVAEALFEQRHAELGNLQRSADAARDWPTSSRAAFATKALTRARQRGRCSSFVDSSTGCSTSSMSSSTQSSRLRVARRGCAGRAPARRPADRAAPMDPPAVDEGVSAPSPTTTLESEPEPEHGPVAAPTAEDVPPAPAEDGAAPVDLIALFDVPDDELERPVSLVPHSNRDFWSDADATADTELPRRRRGMRRFTASTGLRVTAAVLVLAGLALRLG